MTENQIICLDVVKKILNFYQPNFRLLETLNSDFPESMGTFVIPDIMYTTTRRPGLSGAGSVLLMNQAVIAYIITGVILKKIKGLEHIDLRPDDSIQFGNNLLITGYNVKFKKIINRDMPLNFAISIDNIKQQKDKGILFMKGRFNVCNHSHIIQFSGVHYENKVNLFTQK